MKDSAQKWVLCAAAALFFVFMASRPASIWPDEFLHFAFASYPNPLQAMEKIFYSIHGVNHGQTGILMMLNYFLLRWFGASYFVLHLPSIISYILCLFSGYGLLREWGVSRPVATLFFFALGFAPINLTHGLEARPYIMLEASVLAFLWSWHRYLNGKKAGFASMIIASIAGILFHPYFVVYLGLIPLTTFIFLPNARVFFQNQLSRSYPKWIFATALLLVIFLVVGKISWFASLGEKHNSDPYEWIGHSKPLPLFMMLVFFYPLGKIWLPIFAMLSLFLFCTKSRLEIFSLRQIFLYQVFLLVISQSVLAISSINAQYWLLQRQWIAGHAIAFLISAILIEAALRYKTLPENLLKNSIKAIWIAGFFILIFKINKNFRADSMPPVPAAQTQLLLEKYNAQKELSMNDFVLLANQNLFMGGPVWPIFQRYY